MEICHFDWKKKEKKEGKEKKNSEGFVIAATLMKYGVCDIFQERLSKPPLQLSSYIHSCSP